MGGGGEKYLYLRNASKCRLRQVTVWQATRAPTNRETRMRRFSQSLRCSMVLLALAAAPVSAQELPTTSIAGAEDGVAAAFSGAWSAIRPTADSTLLTCMLPTLIRSEAEGGVIYTDIGGRDFPFTVTDAGGQTVWAGAEETQTSVWTGPDSFILYPHLQDGSLDVERGVLYERCEIWPRESHAGAVAGAVEPFAGNWSEALPPERGAGRPLQQQSTCETPTRFEVAGEQAIVQLLEGQEPLTLPVAVRDGRTIFPNDGYTQTVIWVSPDRWHLHGLNIDGGTDWNLPVIFTRCP